VVRKQTLSGSLESGLSIDGDFVLSLSQTSASLTPSIMPLAYTGATVVLCERPSNPGVKRTAKRRCRSVPVTLRVPAAGYVERWAS